MTRHKLRLHTIECVQCSKPLRLKTNDVLKNKNRSIHLL